MGISNPISNGGHAGAFQIDGSQPGWKRVAVAIRSQFVPNADVAVRATAVNPVSLWRFPPDRACRCGWLF